MSTKTLLSAGLAAFLLALAPMAATSQIMRDTGWWVVLGSIELSDNNFTQETDRIVRGVSAAAARCGFKAFQDFSLKFRGFTAGYAVVVIGAYGSQAAADQALGRVKKCVGGAYVKYGAYAGE